MNNFKNNVINFYKWFAANEATIRDYMDKDQQKEAYQLLQPELDAVLHGLLFQIHKDTAKNRYYLEFTTLLDDSKKIVAFSFCDELPLSLRNKWSFYYYHPAFKGSTTFAGKTYTADMFNIRPKLNKKTRKIDVEIQNNPAFKSMNDQEKFLVSYMVFTDYLGEMTVDAYVGGISFEVKHWFKKQLDFLPITEMEAVFNEIISAQKWVQPKNIKLIAGGFQTKKSNSTKVREDIYEGFSYCTDFLNEEGAKVTNLIDYVKQCGIGYYSLYFEKKPGDDKGNQTTKNEIEKRLNTILSEGKNGFMVSSNTGTTYEYADFLVFDDSVFAKIEKDITKQIRNVQMIEL